jgi:hypothetical protein
MSRKVLLLLLLVTGTVFMAGCVVMPFEPRHWDFPSYFFPFFIFPFGLLGIALYFLPTIIAAVRHKKDILGIVLVNIFLGWTFIGWIVALIWALVGKG